jgi:hypothetical protein
MRATAHVWRFLDAGESVTEFADDPLNKLGLLRR